MTTKTILLHIPEPGDDLPFTVYDDRQGFRIEYNAQGYLAINGRPPYVTDKIVDFLRLPMSMPVESKLGGIMDRAVKEEVERSKAKKTRKS